MTNDSLYYTLYRAGSTVVKIVSETTWAGYHKTDFSSNQWAFLSLASKEMPIPSHVSWSCIKHGIPRSKLTFYFETFDEWFCWFLPEVRMEFQRKSLTGPTFIRCVLCRTGFLLGIAHAMYGRIFVGQGSSFLIAPEPGVTLRGDPVV